ncbi:MAG: hypothetical protein V1904_06380, partial [Bacteroidota bacterium]
KVRNNIIIFPTLLREPLKTHFYWQMQDTGYKIKPDIAGILYHVSVLSETRFFLEMPLIK